MGFFIEIYPDGRNIHEETEGENGAMGHGRGRSRAIKRIMQEQDMSLTESSHRENRGWARPRYSVPVAEARSVASLFSPRVFIRYGFKRLIHPSTSSTCAGSDPVSSKNRLRLRATREREGGRESKGSSCYSSLGST